MSIRGWVEIMVPGGTVLYGYAVGRPAFTTSLDPDDVVEVWLGDKGPGGVPTLRRFAASQCAEIDSRILEG